MTVRISSVGLKGLAGYIVGVEVQITRGNDAFVIVGLPDASVKESKERVLSVLHTLECDVSGRKIVVHLSPSEQKKNGPLFDLAIAIGILKEMKELKVSIPNDVAFIGALSLDGTVQSVEGMLPALVAAGTLGYKEVYLPYDPLIPLHMFHDLQCNVVHHIAEVLEHLNGQTVLSLHLSKETTLTTENYPYSKDFSHIIGHEQAKRALEIAAAGEHNVLMSGPPGCGKSLLSESFPSIMPELTNEAQLEVMSLYQLAGEVINNPIIPPFRNPHHSASSVAIIGGGSNPKPGEISLAHRGVLFLDEMAEFTKKTLDMLRQPIETGKVTISRAHSTVVYPAAFILIGAMNPCPCAYLGSQSHYCSCSPNQIKAYRNRISGPVYDRMDILLSLNAVSLKQPKTRPESSAEIRKRIQDAREIQYERYQAELCNAKVPFEFLQQTTPLKAHQEKMIDHIATKHHYSNRVQIKLIRLARTISDLKGEATISDASIWEALQLRRWNDTKIEMIARET